MAKNHITALQGVKASIAQRAYKIIAGSKKYFWPLVLLTFALWFMHSPKPSDEPLVVVIPVIAKDLEILPLTVAAIRQHLQHPIAKIVIIAAPNSQIIEFCHKNNLELLAENQILERAAFLKLAQKSKVATTYPERPATWFYQQLLKLYYANLSPTSDYLVIDADVVLQRALTVKSATGVYQLYSVPGSSSTAVHKAYLCATNKLLHTKYNSNGSYVSELMLFNSNYVKQMIATIEANTQQELPTAILAVSSLNSQCRFSEYETYGYYVTNLAAAQTARRYLIGLPRSRKLLQENSWWLPILQFVVYHDWIGAKEN